MLIDAPAAWTMAGCGLTLVINSIVVAYGYGKVKQKLDDVINRHERFETEMRVSVLEFGKNLTTICSDVGYLKGRLNGTRRNDDCNQSP